MESELSLSCTSACIQLGGVCRARNRIKRGTPFYGSLVLLWGFPNQLSSDSWAVGFEEADPCSALDCETTNGSGSKIFCPGEKVMWAAMQQTTGCSLMRFFTDIERESLGVIRPRVLATGTSYTSALTDGDVSKSPLQKTEQPAA